jgi:16S rRNA processing protein RimM
LCSCGSIARPHRRICLTSQVGLIANKPPEARVSLIRIGRIIGVHGLRGGLRFRPDNPESESIQTIERVLLGDGDTASADATNAREFRVIGVAQVGRGNLRVMLEGITDPNLAEPLKGKNVFVDERELPPPAENEFYFRDVIGCEVFLTDGWRIGAIQDVIATGANDVFVVHSEDKEFLVPVIEDVVKEIDVAARRVVIEAVPGLLD